MPNSCRLSPDQAKTIQGSSASTCVCWPSGDTSDRPSRPLYAIHDPSGAHFAGLNGMTSDAMTCGAAPAPTRLFASHHLPAAPLESWENAIQPPSGDQVGSCSSPLVPVSLTGGPPATGD